MADTTALKNRIRAAVKANDNQEITGPVLQQALLDMVDELNGATETEASQRQSGDSTLSGMINSETQQRQSADNALHLEIGSEAQARQNADTALGQRITQEINQERQRAENAFDDLDMIDAAGSQVSPEAINLTLRKNDGPDEDPEWRTLCQLLIPSATNQRAGLMSAAMRNLLYNLRNAGYAFGGIAVTATNPGVPSGNCFYIVRGAGTYTHFKNADNESIVLENDGIYVLTYESVENNYWEWNPIIGIDKNLILGSNNLLDNDSIIKSICIPFNEWPNQDYYVRDRAVGQKIGNFSESAGYNTIKVFLNKGDILKLLRISTGSASKKIMIANSEDVVTGIIDKIDDGTGTVNKHDYEYTATENCFVYCASNSGAAYIKSFNLSIDNIPTKNSDKFVLSGAVKAGFEPFENLCWNYNTYINKDNFEIRTYPSDPNRYKTSNEIIIVPGCTFTLNGTFGGNICAVVVYRDKYGRVLTNDVILAGTFDNVTLTPPSEAYTVQFTKGPNLDIIFNKPAYQEKFNKKINDSILLYDLPIDFPSELEGKYIRISDGSEGLNDTYKATDFISIKGYRQLLITGTISGSVNAGLAFYDQDKKFISSLGTGEEVTLNRELVQIPVNAWYIRLSCNIDKTYEIKLLNVPSLELETNQLYKVDLQYKPNNYLGLNYDAQIKPYSSNIFRVSREIKIKPDSEFWLDGKGSGNSLYVYAFYRKDGSLISGLDGTELRTFNMEKLVIPNDPDIDTLRLTEQYAPGSGFYLNLYTTKDSLLNILDCKDGNSLSELVSKGGTVYLDDVNYYVDTTINVPSNTAIIGNGRTCIYLGANATKIFNIEGSVNVKIEGIQFYGKTTNIKPASNPVINVAEIRSRTMEGTDVGIYATSYNTTHIDNLIIKDCYFERFNGAGIHFFRTHTDHKRDPKITNCNFFGNWYGLMLDVRSEFNAIVGCSFNNNKIGAYVAGGNNLFSACHFDVNEVGFCVCSTLGDNADHGSSCNCTYNHNTAYGIACVDVGSGFIFTSANCYQGQILIDNSQAVQIVNSVIAVDIINQQTNDTQVVSNRGGVNLITNNLFKGTYMVDSSNPIANKDRLILKNNYWYSKAQDDPSNANINN